MGNKRAPGFRSFLQSLPYRRLLSVSFRRLFIRFFLLTLAIVILLHQIGVWRRFVPTPKQLQCQRPSPNVKLQITSTFDSGLVGHAFTHVLQCLPWIEANGLKPVWKIRSEHYGDANRDWDIVGSSLIQRPGTTSWDPSVEKAELECDAMDLQCENGKNILFESEFFLFDFTEANRLFHKYFDYPERLHAAVDSIMNPYAGKRVLGVHFRGTDKQTDKAQATPIGEEEMMLFVQDFHRTHTVDHIFVATDEKSFLDRMKASPYGHKVFAVPQARAGESHQPLWNNHKASDNLEIAGSVLMDVLILARCSWVLKCSSAVSSWAKVVQPTLPALQVQAMPALWWPQAFTGLYRSTDPAVQVILEKAQHRDALLQMRDHFRTRHPAIFGQYLRYTGELSYEPNLRVVKSYRPVLAGNFNPEADDGGSSQTQTIGEQVKKPSTPSNQAEKLLRKEAAEMLLYEKKLYTVLSYSISFCVIIGVSFVLSCITLFILGEIKGHHQVCAQVTGAISRLAQSPSESSSTNSGSLYRRKRSIDHDSGDDNIPPVEIEIRTGPGSNLCIEPEVPQWSPDDSSPIPQWSPIESPAPSPVPTPIPKLEPHYRGENHHHTQERTHS